MNMRILYLLTYLLLTSQYASAHKGDRVYPIFEITDEELERIDLTDGSIEDWQNLLGGPTLTATDLRPAGAVGSEYDPGNLDYHIWLAWHDSGRIYMAIGRIDDIYVNTYLGKGVDTGFNTGQMSVHDSANLMVDGDHSGGPYQGFCSSTSTGPDLDCIEESRNRSHSTAQSYTAIAETPDGRFVDSFSPADWISSQPYADGGGKAWGEAPHMSVTEFYVTAFDRVVWDDEPLSEISRFEPDQIIGLGLRIEDYDDKPGYLNGRQIFPDPRADYFRTASAFADVRLIGVRPGDTSVENISWARIKQSLTD